MTLYVTRHGKITGCRYRAGMMARFESKQVSLPLPPRKWTPTGSSGAPAVEVRL